MNYFSLFELPESLKIDEAAIMKAYYRLSRRYHPDANVAADAGVQSEAETMSAMINRARYVLSRPDLRLEYILETHGVLLADEKYSLPMAFLGEMMEINEKLMELEMEQDTVGMQAAQEELTKLEAEIAGPVEVFFNQDILQLTDTSAGILKEYFYKKKYLQRIRERLLRLS